MQQNTFLNYLKYYILLNVAFYSFDWLALLLGALLEKTDFATFNSQYHFHWTWLVTSIFLTYLKFRKKE
jgi:hypothetical protein